jgi:hypothetical protein
MQQAGSEFASARVPAGDTPSAGNGLHESLRNVRSWVVQRRLLLVTGLVAAAPIIAATAEAVARGWVPYSDDAVVAVRAFDVFTTRTPLLGQWSSGYSAVVDVPTYGLGPLLFWLLALPARLPWPGAFEITIGLVNVASVMGAVGLAHRRGGRPLMFAVAVAIPLMCASLPTETYSDIWNPSAALLPFTLLIFLAWSVASGEYRLLPLTVLVASFVSQCHLGYAIPVLGLVIVGGVGLALSRASRGIRQAVTAAGGTIDETRPVRRWALGATLVGLLCFSAPLLEQAIHRPGNFVLLVRAATAGKPTVGLDAGWRAVVHTIGIPPWWLQGPQVPIERIGDLSADSSFATVGSAVVALAALLVLARIAWRRRRVDIASAAAIGLVLCGSVIVVTASTPQDAFPTVGYTLRWAAPAGMWVWLVLAWAVATLWGPARFGTVMRRSTFSGLAGLALVAIVGGLVAANGELRREPHDEMHAISEQVDAALPPEGAVLVAASSAGDASFVALGFHAGLVYSLRRAGRDVAVPVGAAVFGGDYAAGARHPAQTVRVDVDKPPPEGARVIARLSVAEYPDPGDPFAPKTAPIRDVAVTLVKTRPAR